MQFISRWASFHLRHHTAITSFVKLTDLLINLQKRTTSILIGNMNLNIHNLTLSSMYLNLLATSKFITSQNTFKGEEN